MQLHREQSLEQTSGLNFLTVFLQFSDLFVLYP